MPDRTEARPHPRAGMVIGADVIVGWLGAIGVAIASDNSSDGESRAAPYSAARETPTARAGRAWPGYHEAGAD
jgi:hypothetical protein